jgi:hypothetical protein
MNAALELHDSDVEAIASSGDCLRIVFSNAYIHRSIGRPGVDAGSGHLQPAELVLSGGVWSEPTPGCRGAISDGSLVVNGQSMSLVPLPFSNSGQVALRLVFVSGERLTVTASSVSCSSSGESRYVESFAGK